MFDDHRIAREHCRHDHVDRSQKWVVPSGQIEHHAERSLLDASGDAVRARHFDVGEGCILQRKHGARARGHGAHLAKRLSERLAHHAADVVGDVAGTRLERLSRILDQRLTL